MLDSKSVNYSIVYYTDRHLHRSRFKMNFFYIYYKIISLDETSISPAMIAEYSRCTSDKRCIIKTDNTFFFLKFTLLVAIKNTKCIG